MSKTIFATITTVGLALAAAQSAMASEATEFPLPVSTKSRAEVQAELKEAQRHPTVIYLGEATVFVDQPPAAHALVTAQPAEDHASTQVIELGEATVFVDQPGTRNRAEVRAEARAAARAARDNPTYGS